MSAPKSNSLNYKERKNKGDKTLSSKVTKSRKKVEAEVDKFAEFFPGEKLSRADRVARAHALLKSLPGPIDAPQHLVDTLAQVFTTGIVPCAGEVSELLPMWQLFLKAVAEAHPAAARQLSSDPRHFEAFTWATAGAIGVIGHWMDPVEYYLIVKLTKGKEKGRSVVCFRLKSGETVRMPKGYEPGHPMFLWPGVLWRRKPVTSHAVANVKCLWTLKELKGVFQPILWHPSRALRKRLHG